MPVQKREEGVVVMNTLKIEVILRNVVYVLQV